MKLTMIPGVSGTLDGSTTECMCCRNHQVLIVTLVLVTDKQLPLFLAGKYTPKPLYLCDTCVEDLQRGLKVIREAITDMRMGRPIRSEHVRLSPSAGSEAEAG